MATHSRDSSVDAGDDLVVTLEDNGDQLLIGGESSTDADRHVALAIDHGEDLSVQEQQDLVDDLRPALRTLVGRPMTGHTYGVDLDDPDVVAPRWPSADDAVVVGSDTEEPAESDSE
ncbi:hypothetical protein [Haloarcula sp. CBA1127]|uniref:hypothetical protein n=1 Tax=Haloarcula sp. CBA1127 TaxID=1765055 RepID=UPI00073F32D1|nr:hypothetical protein [Haloarcula sp. CBA1127]